MRGASGSTGRSASAIDGQQQAPAHAPVWVRSGSTKSSGSRGRSLRSTSGTRSRRSSTTTCAPARTPYATRCASSTPCSGSGLGVVLVDEDGHRVVVLELGHRLVVDLDGDGVVVGLGQARAVRADDALPVESHTVEAIRTPRAHP